MFSVVGLPLIDVSLQLLLVDVDDSFEHQVKSTLVQSISINFNCEINLPGQWPCFRSSIGVGSASSKGRPAC